jgi:hypothetical protein
MSISKIATTATTAPAMGVHNPAMRRSAASISEAQRMMMCNGEPLHSLGPACQRTTAPTTRRISSRPAPGQPPAKVEYRRRNADLDYDYWAAAVRSGLPRGVPGLTLSGGDERRRDDYSSIMPRLRPTIAACVRSLASSFARMLLTRPFTVSSLMASWSAICLFALPSAIRRNTTTSAGVSV